MQSQESERFWLERLEGRPDTRLPRWPDVPPLEFPHEVKTAGEWRYQSDPAQRYGAVETLLAPWLCDQLEQVARGCGVPLKTVVLAAYLRAVGHLTASHDVLVGVTANGRLEELGGEEVRGLFLNTLPMRVVLPDGSWEDLVRAVFVAEGEMLPHRRYPLASLQRKLGGEQLIEANFVYNHFHVMEDVLAKGVKFLDGKIDSFTTQRAEPTDFPLNVGVIRNPAGNGLLLGIDYHTDVLREDQVVVFREYLLKALHDLATDPAQRYLCNSLSTAAEVELVRSWSAAVGEAGAAGCVHELVQRQARRSPGAVAVVCDGAELTYGQLDARANRVAHLLRGRGVGAE